MCDVTLRASSSFLAVGAELPVPVVFSAAAPGDSASPAPGGHQRLPTAHLPRPQHHCPRVPPAGESGLLSAGGHGGIAGGGADHLLPVCQCGGRVQHSLAHLAPPHQT